MSNSSPFHRLYVPHKVTVLQDLIDDAASSIGVGLDYARECLARHDEALGRTTRGNKSAAETMENDIKLMETTYKQLREVR